uniref:Centrosomal protein 131 n=1 Tax=Microcebus murinus TaxID=30608 RepID=A0A8C5VT19_MICMU
MKGSRASASVLGGGPEGGDLSLTGVPPPVSRRPSSASAAKPLARSVSVVTGSEQRRKVLEAMGPGGSRAINNLRRSNSTTQVSQLQTSPPRPAEPSDFLALFEGSPDGRARPAGLSKAPSEKGATWNVLDGQPRAFAVPSGTQGCSADSAVGPRRKECAVVLAPSFTANNRSNKGAVGNCVTTMVHNRHSPAEKGPPVKSSNQAAPSLNNIVKAATREGKEGSSLAKLQKNVPSTNLEARSNAGDAAGLLRRREVTEEEAERFIRQVNQAAVTIQRWYRRQAQRRRAGAARLEQLLGSKREEQQQRQGEGTFLDLHLQKEAARRKAREEKARQARRAAIQVPRGPARGPQQHCGPEPNAGPGAGSRVSPPRPVTLSCALQGPVLEAGRGHLEPASEVSTSMMRLKLEVEEKRQAMALLQRALAQQRDLTARRVKETEKELSRQLQRQKTHYEATIQRHLAFIDQLIEDKKVLSEKCEAVLAELKQEDQRCRARVARAQEQHELEIRKLKELMSATEKVRREKWISLEPEIQKLIAKHKQEVRKLKGLHEAELLQLDERASQRYLRQATELREQLEREKEALGQQERERARQRFEQHLEQEQWALQQQRQRLYNEVAAERERLEQQAARQRAELEELRQQLEDSSSALTQALRAEFEKGREEQERRHQVELKALKEQLELERQAWAAGCARKEEAWLLNREQELKEEIRKGRDKEIELVIQRLEADMALAKEESERAAESRIRRIRDKYEAELSELEQSERKLQERCTELKGRLGEAEGESLRLQGLVRQKELALEDAQAVNERLSGERSNLAQVIRQEFADRLAASEEETRQVRAELAELQARQRLELEEVHQRVKVALAKKEEAVSSLRKQHEAAVGRAQHLEELLERRQWPLQSAK